MEFLGLNFADLNFPKDNGTEGTLPVTREEFAQVGLKNDQDGCGLLLWAYRSKVFDASQLICLGRFLQLAGSNTVDGSHFSRWPQTLQMVGAQKAHFVQWLRAARPNH